MKNLIINSFATKTNLTENIDEKGDDIISEFSHQNNNNNNEPKIKLIDTYHPSYETMQSDYIYIGNKVVHDALCDDIINYYEIYKKNTRDGVTTGGVNKNIKNTTDITFFMENENTFFSKIFKTISEIIFQNVEKWNTNLKKMNQHANVEISFMDKHLFLPTGILCQKYKKNSGFYIYHHDFNLLKDYSYRVITFIIYLNDVLEGGETEFFGNIKIKPRRGRIVLFPASWTFPHRGIVPISDDKYILTGWIHTDSIPVNLIKNN